MNKEVKGQKRARDEVRVSAKPKVLYVLFYYWRSVERGLSGLLSGKIRDEERGEV